MSTDPQHEGERDQLRRKKVAAVVAITVIVAVVGAVVALAIATTPAKKVFDPNARAVDPPLQSTYAAAPQPDLRIPTQIAAPLVRPTPYPAAVSCAYSVDEPPEKPVNPPPTANISARGTVPVGLVTSIGQIDLTLDRALAPCTVNSFVSLARQGFFDNTDCHRLTTSDTLQVLQCGDPTATGSGGPGYKFADETYPELTYGRGQIAMANAGPDTNGSQFFMIYGDASGLPPDYTVFGTISPVSLPLLDTVARDGLGASTDETDGEPHTKVTIKQAKVKG